MPTVEHLLKLTRKRLDDELGSDSQKNWQDWELVIYLSEGQQEINKELQLLKFDEDFTEVTASGTLTLSGTTGQFTSVSVNGVVITSSAVPFNGTIAQTLLDVASNINAFSASGLNVIQPLSAWLEKTTIAIPYIASANGSVLTITAPSDTGFSPNGYAITSVMTGDMTFVSTSLSGGSCLCKLFLIPGQRRYQIHQKTYLITRFKAEHIEEPIYATTKNDMDETNPGWDKMRPGRPVRYIPDLINKNIIMIPQPRIYKTCYLDVVRYPYKEFSLSNISATPEIPEEYQSAIVIWALRQAYLKGDRETLNTVRSQTFEREFTRLVEQYRINHKIRQNPMPPINRVPAGFL
jgi:hypothetical protein